MLYSALLLVVVVVVSETFVVTAPPLLDPRRARASHHEASRAIGGVRFEKDIVPDVLESVRVGLFNSRCYLVVPDTAIWPVHLLVKVPQRDRESRAQLHLCSTRMLSMK